MSSTSESVLLEVLARVPSDLLHCSHCERIFGVAGIGTKVHQEIRASYPPELLEEAELLADRLRALSCRYGERLRIHVVDVQSMEGFFKSLRHRVFQYPAFIVDRQRTCVACESGRLEHLLEARIAAKVSRGGE